jgi:hypothetical protein
MEAIKLTYNLEKDVNSGAIKVYSPNHINDFFKNYNHLVLTASMHSFSPLEAANSMMSMYRMNYCKPGREEDRPESFDAVNKWNEYYAILKSRKKYKCKECGWKGKIIEMDDGIEEEFCCPNCREDFKMSEI